MAESSSSQKRRRGAPRKLTGAGITARTSAVLALSCVAPRLISRSRSTLCQSRWPSAYCVAVRGVSSLPRRPGDGEGVLQALGVPRARRLWRASGGRSKRASCCASQSSIGALHLGPVGGRHAEVPRQRAPAPLVVPERGHQAPGVERPPRHQVPVGERLGVQAGALRGARRLQGEAGQEVRAVAARGGLGVQQAQEVQPGFDRQAQGAVLAGADRLALHQRFQGHGPGVVARGAELRVGLDGAGVVAGDGGADRPPARQHRGAGVLALELARLPLPGQQPQGIVDAGVHACAHLVVAAARFQADPAGDRSHWRYLTL